jgi:hypothetical protein
LAGDRLSIVQAHRGGLWLAPLSAVLRWPFYRMRRTRGKVYQALEAIARWDLQRERGAPAWNLEVVLRLPSRDIAARSV